MSRYDTLKFNDWELEDYVEGYTGVMLTIRSDKPWFRPCNPSDMWMLDGVDYAFPVGGRHDAYDVWFQFKDETRREIRKEIADMHWKSRAEDRALEAAQ